MSKAVRYSHHDYFILKLRAVESNIEYLESLLQEGIITPEEKRSYLDVINLQFSHLISHYNYVDSASA